MIILYSLCLIYSFAAQLILDCDANSGHKRQNNRRDTKFLKSNSKVSGGNIRNINTDEDYSAIEKLIKTITLENCGLKSATNYIVGGEEAVRNEFPFIASVHFNGSHSCGASIINKLWLISAAHCFQGGENYILYYRIITGAHNRKYGDQYKIVRIIAHQKFNRAMLADIALIRVDRQIEFNANVSSICLPAKQYSDPSGVMTVAGWGLLYQDSQTATNFLQKVDVSIISDQMCSNMFFGLEMIDIYRPFLCAYTPEKDACGGDSGGPAFHYVDGRAVLLGIVSFGYGCATQYPGVYTQVSYFLDWVASNILYKPKLSPRNIIKR